MSYSNEVGVDFFDRIDVNAFSQAGTLSERINLVYSAVGRRLYSHTLAEIWADWFNKFGLALDRSQRIRLVKEILLLSPNNPKAEDLYNSIMRGQEFLAPSDTPVFMVVSCQKYLEQALALRSSLLNRGAVAWVITGSLETAVPVWHEFGCVLPVSDAYEALPLKVAKGIEAIVERYGVCTVVKIDDDCQITDNFSVDHFRKMGAQYDYIGVPCEDPLHDRLWHYGKTSCDAGVYARRFHGAWARGACYLLGAHSASLIAHESVLFPGEFSSEHYEDKAIGDFLRRQGVVLHSLSSQAEWGVAFDCRERFLPTVVGDESVVATPVLPEGVGASSVSVGQHEATAFAPSTNRTRIPKVLHLTWVGDDTKRPDNCIQTWIDQNPGWTIKIWGNDDLRDYGWVNARHIRSMWGKELNGVADLMRWEILYNEGGIVVDADSVCVRPLDDWLLEADAIACWENEFARPRLVGCNMVGSVPENPFFGQIIKDINAEQTVVNDMAWKTVGPLRLTTAYFKYQYTGLTVLPSHFFIPDHFSGVHYEGGGIVYARQEWASTHQSYDSLHLKSLKEGLHK